MCEEFQGSCNPFWDIYFESPAGYSVLQFNMMSDIYNFEISFPPSILTFCDITSINPKSKLIMKALSSPFDEDVEDRRLGS